MIRRPEDEHDELQDLPVNASPRNGVPVARAATAAGDFRIQRICHGSCVEAVAAVGSDTD